MSDLPQNSIVHPCLIAAQLHGKKVMMSLTAVNNKWLVSFCATEEALETLAPLPLHTVLQPGQLGEPGVGR